MPLSRPPALPASLLFLGLVYGLAVLAAAAVAWKMPGPVPVKLLVADLAATLVVFAGSRAVDNSSVYDPYWSVAPPLLLGLGMAMDGPTARTWLLLAALSVWSLRLTTNFLRGWSGLGQEDWRYVELRARTGRLYWPVSLLGLHLFPTAVVALGMLGAVPALDSHTPIGTPDLVGAVLILIGTIVSLIADEQVRIFKRTADPGAVCDLGLWGWSRHPNYLGELVVWLGVWLVGVGAERWSWHWTLLGPLAMVLLFEGISIPLHERRAARVRRGWAAYVARTGRLLPAPWRRG